MKSTIEYLNELEILLNIEIEIFTKKIQHSDKIDYDKIVNEFESSISKITTDILHKTIIGV